MNTLALSHKLGTIVLSLELHPTLFQVLGNVRLNQFNFMLPVEFIPKKAYDLSKEDLISLHYSYRQIDSTSGKITHINIAPEGSFCAYFADLDCTLLFKFDEDFRLINEVKILSLRGE